MRNVVDEDLFTFVLNQEILKANRLRYSLSVLCLTPDIADALERRATRDLVADIANVAVRRLRALDLGTILVPAFVAVLLIDAEPQNLEAIVRRVIEAVEGYRVRVGGEERPVTLSVGAASYPRTAATAKDLLQQAFERMTAALKDGGARAYLPA